MNIKFLTNYRLTKGIPLACVFNCLLAIATFAQTNISTKADVKPIDPLSIDLTRPTLFAVPYTHLDDMWRWSYPQVIRDFLKNTLDDNFKSIIPKNMKNLKNGLRRVAGTQAAAHGLKMMLMFHPRNLWYVRF